MRMVRLFLVFLVASLSFLGCAAETATRGALRTTHFCKVPKGNWRCAAGSQHNVSDYFNCLALLNCKTVSCYVIVFDHRNKNCCAVASPYDWVILRVGDALLKDQEAVDTVIVRMWESSSTARENFTNLWPPASAMFLDQTNKMADFGYLSSHLQAIASSIQWTKTGGMISNKTVKSVFAYFNKASRSHIKLWPTNRFNFSLGSTIAMWIKISAPDRVVSPLFEFRTDTARYTLGWLYPSSYLNQLYLRVPSRAVRTGLNVVQNNGPWTHVAFTWAPGNHVSIFVNGISQALTTYSGTATDFTTGDYLYLGYVSPSDSRRFTGGFACFFIYEKALTSKDLKNVMQLC